MTIIKHPFIFLILLIVLASCKTREFQAKHPSAQDREPVGNIAQDNTAEFIDALREKSIGNYSKAEDLLKKCLEKNPQDAASEYELAQVLALTGNNESAIHHAKRAVDLDPENNWYQLFLAGLYKVMGNYSANLDIWKQLVKDNPDNIDYLFELANNYIFAGEYQEAISIYNDIENKTGVSEQISIQKQKLYNQAGDRDKAIREIEKLIEHYPLESRYYAILAETYLSNGRDAEALAAYKKIVELDPDDPFIHISLSDYYRKKGKKEEAFEELKMGFENPQLAVDTKVQILLAYYTVNELYSEMKEQALELAEALITAHPEDPKAYSIYADLLYQQNELVSAREAFRKVISLDSSKYVVWEQLLFVDSELRDYTAMAGEAKRAVELFPQQPLLYLFAGIADYQLKKYQGAVDYLERGMNFVIENNAMLTQFYSNLGDAYNALKDFGNSDKYYDKALDIEPLNSVVLNNYAYYLSLRNVNLEKAESMARKAVELDSLNHANLDTYAWVLYRLGKYDEAKVFIEKALENGGDKDDTVLEHYGDVLYKLGDQQGAVEYWKKAREFGKGSGNLEVKISEGVLYEE